MFTTQLAQIQLPHTHTPIKQACRHDESSSLVHCYSACHAGKNGVTRELLVRLMISCILFWVASMHGVVTSIYLATSTDAHYCLIDVCFQFHAVIIALISVVAF